MKSRALGAMIFLLILGCRNPGMTHLSGIPLSRRSFRRANTTWPRNTTSTITTRAPCVISTTVRDADATRGSKSSGGMPRDTNGDFSCKNNIL
jgi:hypothetical protein